MRPRNHLLKLALEAAAAASQYALQSWHNHHASIKADGSLVTEVDLAIERLVRGLLAKGAPRIACFGEELGYSPPPFGRYWVIDPIDGTRWYHLGVPVFGFLLALMEANEPVLGVIALPATGEVLYAAKSQGCYYQRAGGKPQRVTVTQAETLAQAQVSTSGLHGSDLWLEQGSKPYKLLQTLRLAKAFYFTGDCLQHLLLARGRLDAAIDTLMKPWDSAALIPCIQEAGGYACSLDGQTTDLINRGSLLTCSTKALADEIITALRPAL